MPTTTTETVSKTKDAVAEGAGAPVRRKTMTNWSVLRDAGFTPVRFRCDGYLGKHPADLTCHTNFPPTAENVLNHCKPEHGGGWFKVRFRISDGKQFPLWMELQDEGLEIQHLYCPHCREEVAISPRAMIRHLQPHAGANRVNLEPQTLCMTLGFDRPEQDEMESLYEVQQG